MSLLENRFSANLKRYRKKLGITQKKLAEAVGCSEKAVSKWECAASIPDIEVLLAVSQVLRTNVEALFGENDEVYFLGIDAGGTKTHMMLTDMSRNTVKTVFADCGNPMDVGLERVKTVLRDAIYEICDNIPFASVVCFAGIAGGTSGGMREALTEFFAEFNFHAVRNDSDNKNIISAGLGKRDGITLILGTGVCSFLQKGEKHMMTGGNGYLIDNGGSGYNLGREVLNAYFCEKDGTGDSTEITREIEESGEKNPKTLLDKIYGGGKKYIASFSNIVFAAARKGDAIAIDIIRRNMKEAARLVEANASHLDCKKIPLVLAGGLTNEPMTIEYLKEALSDADRFDIRVLDKAPVEGAIMLARQLYETEKRG